MNVFVKIQKKKNRDEGVRADVNGKVKFFENQDKNWGGGGACQGRCERRIDVFVKIKENFFG